MIHFNITLAQLVLVAFSVTFLSGKDEIFENFCSDNYTFSEKTVFRSSHNKIGLFTISLARTLRKTKPLALAHHKKRLSNLYLCTLLLLLSYAPEPNPGPSSTYGADVSHYPCGTCDVSVSWTEKGVACDTCGIWYHARCQSIPTLSYENLHGDVSWHCAICGNPNSETVFDLHGVDWPNTSSLNHDTSNFSCTTPTETTFKPHHVSTPTRISQQNKWKKRPLRVVTVNFRSAVGKRPQTLLMLDSMKPDIILACETWLDGDIKDNEFLPSDIYTIYRKDRNRLGGGVLIAVRSDLNSHEVPELATECEMIWAAIKLHGRKTLYVCSYYRPHENDEPSLRKLEESFNRLAKNQNHVYLIGGDFNFPDWDYTSMTLKPNSSTPSLHRAFASLLDDHGLEQMVSSPTRLNNTLDLLLTNAPQLVPRVEVVPGLSDHDIPFCEFNVHSQKIKQIKRPIKLFNKADWEGMRGAMQTLHTELVSDQCRDLTTEDLWSKFRSAYETAVETFIPTKTAGSKDNKPWITAEIKKKSKRLLRVHKKKLKRKLPEHEEETKKLRREIQRMTRRSYWRYVDGTMTAENESTQQRNKKFYTFVKHQRSSGCGIPPLKVDGQLVSESKAQAEVFNRQFQSVFSDGREYTEDEFRAKVQMNPVELTSTLSDITISEPGIRKILQKLNPYKACGRDNIHPRVLRELATDIAPILTIIFQSSINTGVVPSDWRDANVSPIYKKGTHYDPANYRPVSLTSVPCKILEHVVTSALMTHLEENNILRPEQHGFRKSRSCETQLLDFCEELNENLEKGRQSDIVIMDFAKAFDKVNHSLLIHKLQHYGVIGNINQWLNSFLSGRRQAVIVNGTTSEFVSVRSGVPQGSVVGPALFLAYINDLPEQLTSLTRLFADDTAVYRLSASENDQSQLQEDLRRLEVWEKSWDMEFHPGKCTTLPVTRSATPKNTEYQLHGHTLATVNSAKYLGVTLTRDLSWDTHINNICQKANKTLGFLRRNLKISSSKIKETAYKTFVRPILEYACTVWDPSGQNNINRLEAVQRRAARFVVNRYHNTSSVSCMIDKLQWPSLKHRRKVARLTMLRKILDEEAAFSMKNIKAAPPRRRRGHSRQLVQIQCRTDYRKYSFLPNTIREWNCLPSSAVEAATLDSFKSRVPPTS